MSDSEQDHGELIAELHLSPEQIREAAAHWAGAHGWLPNGKYYVTSSLVMVDGQLQSFKLQVYPPKETA